MSIYTGIDHLLTDMPPELKRHNVGLVTNSAATTLAYGAATPPLTPSRGALQAAGVNLVRLFGPEHGLAGGAVDGASVTDARDSLTGLPVVSLYGESFAPSAESLADLDLLLFDIPDVGVRFYTYIWTLSYVMEACAATGLPLWVLDRPNPIGGNLDMCEGPMLADDVTSFVGRWPMPVRHSLTVGELATYWNASRRLDIDLRVIPARDWLRTRDLPDLSLPFVPASPNMPDIEAAQVYPGTCFFEGTNVSEGRGTATPFRGVGAPWLHAQAVADAVNAHNMPGARARAYEFIPSSGKYAGEVCQGVMLHVTNRKTLRPVALGLTLLTTIAALQPDEFAWLPYPTAARGPGYGHFDALIGRTDIRMAIDAGGIDEGAIRRWTACGEWRGAVTPYLLYH